MLEGLLSLASVSAAAPHKGLRLPALHEMLHASSPQLKVALRRTCHNGLQLLLLTPEANRLEVRRPAQHAVSQRAMTRPSVWRP